jgi:uncharacterized repeat protein (TIGR03803 family)
MLEYKMKRFAISILLLLSTLAFAGEKVLYSFQGGPDGMQPEGPLVSDQAGNLYGTTFYGGTDGLGTVFELSPNGQGGWTESILYSFTGGADGQGPMTGLVLDGQGNLFGTTLGIDGNNCVPKCGSAFELSPNGAGWNFTLLHAFQGGKDGGIVDGGLTIDAAGNLYGTTEGFGPKGYGTVFELKEGNGWKLETLYSFGDVSKGVDPGGTLALGSDGSIFGIAEWGGSHGQGVVYRLLLAKNGKRNMQVVYEFNDGRLGTGAEATGLTSDEGGSLYGVNSFGTGHVLRVSESQGGKWIGKNVFHFARGNFPSGNVLVRPSGNLYGVGLGGGTTDPYGLIYELVLQADGTFVETELYKFKGGDDGSGPLGSLIVGKDRNFYGLTSEGGGTGCNGNGCGTVFEFTP